MSSAATDDLFCDAPPELDIWAVCPAPVRPDRELPGVAGGRGCPDAVQEHASENKFAFSASPDFGFLGDAFVAETGSFLLQTGAVEFTGYRVVGADRAACEDSVFVANIGTTLDEVFDPDSVNKPIDVKFDGDVMMIVDLGVFEPGVGKAQPGTGKVWLVADDRAAIERFPGAADRIAETRLLGTHP